MFNRFLIFFALMCLFIFYLTFFSEAAPKPAPPKPPLIVAIPIPIPPLAATEDPDAIWQESNTMCLADVLAYTPRANWGQMSEELKDNPHVCVIAESLSGHNMLSNNPPKAAYIFAHEAVYARH